MEFCLSTEKLVSKVNDGWILLNKTTASLRRSFSRRFDFPEKGIANTFCELVNQSILDCSGDVVDCS